MDPWNAVVIVTAGLSIAALMLQLAVMRHVARLYATLAGASPEAISAGRDRLPAVGEYLSLDGLSAVRPTLILFTSPGCAACEGLIPQLPEARASLRGVDLVVGAVEPDKARREDYARRIGRFARADLHATFIDLEVPSTPYVIGLAPSRQIIGAGVATTTEHLQLMAERVIAMGNGVGVRPGMQARLQADDVAARPNSTRRIDDSDALFVVGHWTGGGA